MAEMIALRRFRMANGHALSWVEQGAMYSVPNDQVEFHVKTGRGKPVETKKQKGK